MAVDRAYLDATLQNLQRQHDEALQMVERTRGAILLTEALLVELQNEEQKAKATAEGAE